jgi:hypothetical protein
MAAQTGAIPLIHPASCKRLQSPITILQHLSSQDSGSMRAELIRVLVSLLGVEGSCIDTRAMLISSLFINTAVCGILEYSIDVQRAINVEHKNSVFP